MRGVLAGIVALCVWAPGSASAQANPQVRQLERQVEQLRDEVMRLQDQLIESARQFDLERRRLQDENEQLRAENERLQRELRLVQARARAGGGEQPPEEPRDVEAILETQVTVNFDGATLGEVFSFLEDVAGLPLRVHRNVRPEDVTVSLRLRDVSVGNVLQLALASDDELEMQVRDGAVWVRRR